MSKSHALLSIDYESFVNRQVKLLACLAVVFFALCAFICAIFALKVIECSELCDLEGALRDWAMVASIAIIGICGVISLRGVVMARTSAPLRIELTSSGIHVVKRG